jgi:hypothetical protein
LEADAFVTLNPRDGVITRSPLSLCDACASAAAEAWRSHPPDVALESGGDPSLLYCPARGALDCVATLVAKILVV